MKDPQGEVLQIKRQPDIIRSLIESLLLVILNLENP
jgi:hypothetical protein